MGKNKPISAPEPGKLALSFQQDDEGARFLDIAHKIYPGGKERYKVEFWKEHTDLWCGADLSFSQLSELSRELAEYVRQNDPHT